MGLLDRLRRPRQLELPEREEYFDPYRLRGPSEALDGVLSPQFTRRSAAEPVTATARRLAQLSYEEASAAQQTINIHQGAVEDLASVNDSLESVYQIASKLEEIDRALEGASGNELYSQLHHSLHSYPPEQLPLDIAAQSLALAEWVSGVDSEAKQRWFEQMLAVRAEIVGSLEAGYGHLRSLRRDVAFLHSATAAQAILPEFSIADAQAELLTGENAAAKARALADSVAELEAPPLLSTLEESPALPERASSEISTEIPTQPELAR